MPPATAPTPAPTAAPTGPPITAPVTAPVVAPAATPSCACETTGSDSRAVIATLANILMFISPPLGCVCVPTVNVAAGMRFLDKISFRPGTFFPFQHFPDIEFKMLGGFHGTGDAPRGGNGCSCNR